MVMPLSGNAGVGTGVLDATEGEVVVVAVAVGAAVSTGGGEDCKDAEGRGEGCAEVASEAGAAP